MNELVRFGLPFVVLLGLSQILSGGEEKKGSPNAVPLSIDGKQVEIRDVSTTVEEHDFGVVARGSDVRRRVRLKNTSKATVVFQEPVRMTAMLGRNMKLSKPTLTPGEESILELEIDTARFSHEKRMTAVLQIINPDSMEIRLPMKTYIRTDVVFQPGGVHFGTLNKGTTDKQKIEIAYQGRPNWQIQKAESANPSLTPVLAETRRTARGEVNYDLTVTIDGKAPVGEVYEIITLVTDDKQSPNIPLLVTGEIKEPPVKK